MLVVDLGPCRNSAYAPLTVNGPDYLLELGRYIARTIADVEVRTFLNAGPEATAIFRSQCAEDQDGPLG